MNIPTKLSFAALMGATLMGPAAAQGTFDAAGKWIADPPPVSDSAAVAGQTPKTADPLDNQLCSAFGPGFVAVAGGTTCIKIGGYVKVGTSFGHSSFGGPH